MDFMENKVLFNEEDYKNNLLNTDIKFYSKYVEDILRLKHKCHKKIFLDCGCGTGTVLKLLEDKSNNYGIDTNAFFIKEIQRDGYNVSLYDGNIIPFEDNRFDICGSFTVLEHVKDPELFIRENVRVTRKGGYIITACPNFLSFFNKARDWSASYKILKLARYTFDMSPRFVRMDPIIRERHISDDDAIVQTNLIHLVRILKGNKLRIVKIEGVMSQQNIIIGQLAKLPFLRLFLPSCYVVCQKTVD